MASSIYRLFKLLKWNGLYAHVLNLKVNGDLLLKSFLCLWILCHLWKGQNVKVKHGQRSLSSTNFFLFALLNTYLSLTHSRIVELVSFMTFSNFRIIWKLIMSKQLLLLLYHETVWILLTHYLLRYPSCLYASFAVFSGKHQPSIAQFISLVDHYFFFLSSYCSEEVQLKTYWCRHTSFKLIK